MAARYWARHPDNASTQNLKCLEYSIFKASLKCIYWSVKIKTPETKILVETEPSEVNSTKVGFSFCAFANSY